MTFAENFINNINEDDSIPMEILEQNREKKINNQNQNLFNDTIDE